MKRIRALQIGIIAGMYEEIELGRHIISALSQNIRIDIF
jgi:hypothetical protein